MESWHTGSYPLLLFPVVSGLLAVLSTEGTSENKGWRVTSSKCYSSFEKQFRLITNTIDLFIKLGKYVSLLQYSEQEFMK